MEADGSERGYSQALKGNAKQGRRRQCGFGIIQAMTIIDRIIIYCRSYNKTSPERDGLLRRAAVSSSLGKDRIMLPTIYNTYRLGCSSMDRMIVPPRAQVCVLSVRSIQHYLTPHHHDFALGIG